MSAGDASTVSATRPLPNASSASTWIDWRETLAVAGALALFIAIELVALRAIPAVTRPLWLDEIHTYLLASTQTVARSVQSLAAGADYNPPTLYLLYRVVGIVTGGLSEVTMRLVALTSVVGALTITYRLLRSDFDRTASGLAVMATWAHPVVVSVAFDARFYGPWMCGAAWLVLEAMQRVSGRSTGFSSAVRLAVVSLFVCTIHYFGILSLAAVGLAVVTRVGLRDAVRTLAPSLAGPLALACCIPLYFGQRAALTVSTWIPDPTLIDLVFLLIVVLLPMGTVVALSAWGVNALVRRRMRQSAVTERGRFGLASSLLMAQVTVPLVLASFSLVMVPATQPRYWIAGTLAVAPILALAFARAGALAPVAAIAVLICSAMAVTDIGNESRARASIVAEDIADIDRLTAPGSLVVTRRRHTLYPILHARPDLAPRLAVLDATAVQTDRFSIVERDAGRAHQRIYGFPAIRTASELSRMTSFYVMEFDSTRSPTAREFPNDSITRVGPRLFRLERR